MRGSVIILLVIMFASPGLSDESSWRDESESLLKDAATSQNLFDDVDEKLIAARHSASSNTENSVPALLDLWRNGERSLVELAWFKQTRRSTRVVALALFYTQMKMSASNAPDFKGAISRFTKDESAQRSEELRLVEENLAKYRKLLENALTARRKKHEE